MDKTKYIEIANAAEKLGISTDDFKKHIILWMQEVFSANNLLREENEKFKAVNEKLRQSLSVKPNPDGFVDIPETIFSLKGMSTKLKTCLKHHNPYGLDNLLVFTKISEKAALRHFLFFGNVTLQEVRRAFDLYGLEFDNPYSVFKIKNPLNEACHRLSFSEIEHMLDIDGVIYKP